MSISGRGLEPRVRAECDGCRGPDRVGCRVLGAERCKAGGMIRRVLNLVVALALVGCGVVIAARIAEPSVRPVLYPPSASPTSAPPTIAPTTDPPASTTTAAPATTTTTAPVVTTTVPATTTTTTVPVDEVAVLTAAYVWGPSRAAVLLQTVLGIEADGWYGPGTRQAHVAENEARGLPIDAVPSAPTTTTTAAPTTTAASINTAAVTTTAAPTTTVPQTTTVPPPSTTAGMFGGLGAKLVAQLLGQPCIADGDLSDCGPEVDALVKGLVN